jgi:nicotinamide phosphoribosyltransferase
MRIDPLTAIDFYKADHRRQYPTGTEYVYSNLTPRSTHLLPILADRYDGKTTFFGLQGFCKWFLVDCWNTEFFNKPKADVLRKYKRRMDTALGEDSIGLEHIEALHDLGFLPIKIKALPEGSRVGVKVPLLTIVNTDPDFFWLTNYLETVMSAELWKQCTTATIANEYRKMFEEYAVKTGSPLEFVPFQGHDFSCRGMSGIHDAKAAGAGHLTSFVGTDTVSAIDYAEEFYNADAEKELVGTSVPATEHSVMSMGLKESEIDTFRRLITEIYPTGVVSIVSDTWDFWKVLTEYTVTLKEEILARTPNSTGLAKVVFRPDSGDPVLIIAGDPNATPGSPEYKGAVECLWDVFGGTETETGHKLLNERVGLIYGDSITLDRANRILDALEKKGFASANLVFGIGSYTYQFLTRDSLGFAMKATYGVVNGEPREIYKTPKTDNGLKKSARGLLRVDLVEGEYVLTDQATPDQEEGGALEVVFLNGELTRETTFEDVRRTIKYGAVQPCEV